MQQLLKVPLIDLSLQYEEVKYELEKAIHEVLSSGQYIMGSKVMKLEKEIADYCGTKYGVAVANGTDALLLSMEALGIGSGDEVITTPFTFFATAESISRLGATPVFVDIRSDTYTIDASQIEAAITEKTKAIIPVHLFGQPADMKEIMEIAEKYGIHVIEDACQAIGSTYNGQRVGSIGAVGVFSFFPTKNLGGMGDGGMIVTNDEKLAEKIRMLRVHGSKSKYHHSYIGYNSRLDTIQAAIVSVKLPYLDQWNLKRREKAQYYNKYLSDLPIKLPFEAENRIGIYHLYIIETDQRDRLINYLKEKGIGSGVYYPVPLHLQEVYQNLEYPIEGFPIAEKSAQKTLALPLFPEMNEMDQQYVIDALFDFFRRGKSD